MRFLADIPIGRTTLDLLRHLGHDVIHVTERLPSTADDKDILEIARQEGRAILCFDLDFATLVALSGQPLPSIVTFRTTARKGDIINRHLARALPEMVADLERGALVTVEDHRVRIRPLPLGKVV